MSAPPESTTFTSSPVRCRTSWWRKFPRRTSSTRWVASRSCSFANPRPDAVEPETGERYDDVIVIWVESDDDKSALVQDPCSPFFTTDHFNGHRSVLVRASRLGEITREELAELIQDAWLARASKHRASTWLAEHR
jgi:hypothetical protein